jgi:putative DNA primase/helicase
MREALTMQQTALLPVINEAGGMLASGHVDPEKLVERVRAIPPGPPINADPAPLEPGDLGNARVLVESFGKDLRYAPGLGWFWWDGTRWREDLEHAHVMERAKDTARLLFEQAKNLRFEDAKDAAERIRRASQTHEAMRLHAMVRLAQSDPRIRVQPENFDANPWLLNVGNGTLDLKNGGELRDHRREDLITRLAPVEYDAKAECPTFLKFLHEIMAEDETLVGFLRRFFGYALTGNTREQVLAIFYGTGANGKTTLVNAIQSVLGDYAQSTRAETFLMKRGDSISSDLAMLRGARFVSAAESEAGARLAESLVKQVTGGDRIMARKMYKDFFEFTPILKLALVTNHKPIILGSDEAIWRRMLLVPFTVRIREEQRDKTLPETLRAEAPGILSWAVAGCREWQERGLEPPREVRLATQGYREDMDTVGSFVAEMCKVEDDAREEFGTLYTAYARWCEQRGERSMTTKSFGLALEERGFPAGRTRETRFRRGLRLREEPADDVVL